MTFNAAAMRVAGALILLTWGFQTIRLHAAMIGQSQFWESFQSFGGGLIWLALGVTMIIWPLTMARFLIPGGSRDLAPTDWTAANFQSVAFSLMGLYLLVNALTATPFWSIIVLAFIDNRPRVISFDQWTVLGMITRIIIGTWLLLGIRGWIGVLGVVRRARLSR